MKLVTYFIYLLIRIFPYFPFAIFAPAVEKHLAFEDSKILNEDKEQPAHIENIDDFKFPHADKQMNAVKPFSWKWKKSPNGLVNIRYYVDIANNAHRAAVRRVLDLSAADLREYTCIRLQEEEKKPGGDYITVIDPSVGYCYSMVGRMGGKQELGLGEGCQYKGIAEHEMMHALGFTHEQSRPDRDDYITINLNNVYPGVQHNFDKMSTKYFTTQDLAYDYGSIMHYSAYSFALDSSRPVIEPRDGDPAKLKQMGQRRGYTELDIEKINKLYGCAFIQPEEWTAVLYFGKVFQQWNVLTNRLKHRDSLRDYAEELLLTVRERQDLNSMLRDAINADPDLKTERITFKFSFTPRGRNDMVEAMGLRDRNMPFDNVKITRAVDVLRTAFIDGNSSIYSTDYNPSSAVISTLADIIAVLEKATDATATAELAPQNMAELSPRTCSSKDVPATNVAYYGRVFSYLNILYVRSRGHGSVVKGQANTLFDSAANRNSLRGDLSRAFNEIPTLRGARFCFTYTTRATAVNNLESLKSITVAKSEQSLADAVGLLYSAVEQGLTDIKQAYVDNGKNTTDIMADLDAALADTVVWVTTLADNVATATGLNVTSSATEVV